MEDAQSIRRPEKAGADMHGSTQAIQGIFLICVVFSVQQIVRFDLITCYLMSVGSSPRRDNSRP